MPQVASQGALIDYETTGSGEPVLCIAGFGCDRTIWSLAAPKLSPPLRVITFDNRGTGRTTGSEEVKSIAQMAEDAAAVLDALELPSAHVAGHSMGGMIALELALSHADRVRSLTLINTGARTDARNKLIIETWGELPRLVSPEMGARLSLPWVYTESFLSRPGVLDEIMKLIAANPFQPSATALFGQSRAISAFDATEKLGQVACPTLVVAGREDILMRLPSSEQLAQGIRGAEMRIIDGVGHGLPIEAPAALASVLTAFVTRIG